MWNELSKKKFGTTLKFVNKPSKPKKKSLLLNKDLLRKVKWKSTKTMLNTSTGLIRTSPLRIKTYKSFESEKKDLIPTSISNK